MNIQRRLGKQLVAVEVTDHGCELTFFNKGGDELVRVYADDYGHGYLGVGDRKGEGRTLTPR